MSLADIIAEECPGATIELFPNSDSVLVKFRVRQLLLMTDTIKAGESAVRKRLKALVPRSGKPTRVRRKKVVEVEYNTVLEETIDA